MEEAEKYLEQAGKAYYDGKFEEAIKLCSKAIELKPDYAEAYNNRGVCHKEMGDYKFRPLYNVGFRNPTL